MIQFHNYSFTYPGRDNAALKDVSLEIKGGEFVLLCGASGSGKSTLLRQLKSALKPYGRMSGEILIEGQPLDNYSVEEQASLLGFVGQNPREQIVTDKVSHELAFGMENLGLSNEDMFRRMAELCEFFGISSWFQRETESLSGGEVQLLNLASIMLMRPEVLLLDEPTSQLDPIAASEFLQMLGRIHRELGTTIILSEHHLEEAFGMVDRVLVLEEGKLQYQGNPVEVGKQILTNPNALYEGLPSALRMVQALGREENEIPLSVGQGRIWFDSYMSGRKAKTISELTRDFGKKILVAKEIGFTYSGSNHNTLEECNLELHQGECFALLGGNGAGKSTLLKILCQEERQQVGRLEILGKNIKKQKDVPLGYEQMVFLPQDPKAVFTEITVFEELQDTLEELAITEEEKQSQVLSMLCRIGLDGFEKSHPYDLSGGQQQMLALGKMLLLKPKILLLDEPTKGLDPERKANLGAFLRGLCSEGVTILMVSHDVEFCANYSDRCGMLFQGRMVGVGTRREFFAGNQFFTTAINRIARAHCKDAITLEEVVEACKR